MLLKIELECQVYFPCENLETFLIIEEFLMKRKALCQESQAINHFVQYDQIMQYITYTMNRKFQMPLLQYLNLCNNQVIKSTNYDKLIEDLFNVFEQYQIDLIENQRLQIQKMDLKKIWVQIDENYNILSIHIINLIQKAISQNSELQIENINQEFNQLVMESYKPHKNKNGVNKINKFMQTISKIPFHVSKLGRQNQNELLIKTSFQELIGQLDNMSLKDRILNNAVLNNLFDILIDSETELQKDQISEKYKQMSKLFQKNYKQIFDFLSSYVNTVKLKAFQLMGQDAYNLIETSIFSTGENKDGEFFNYDRDIFIIKLLQKFSAIDCLNDLELNNDIKNRLFNYFQQYLMVTLFKLFKNPPTIINFLQVLSLQKEQTYIENIKQSIYQIYNDLLIETQLNLIGFNLDQKYVVFTKNEIENYLISISIDFITKYIQPETITLLQIKKECERQDFFQQRIKFFLGTLTMLQDTLNTSTEELAQKIQFHLISCLEQNYGENLQELLTRIMHEYLSQIVEQNSQI